jgi:regulation of enolase protein 1 (concanavalin A-like superfamily)
MKHFDISALKWINKPAQFSLSDSEIVIHTSPDTDFWRGTYYGLEYNNGRSQGASATVS